MTDKEQLCLVFIPSLISILTNAEKAKGEPLTKEEVIGIRDSSTCVAVKLCDAITMEKERGYTDIIPEDVWDEWQAARNELI